MVMYWLVSVPKDDGNQQQWSRLVEQVKPMSSAAKFNLPNLKVGTLDALMALSDDLAKLDQFTELIMIKVYNYMANALEENDLHKLPEYTKVNNKDLGAYCNSFVWDVAKFPTKVSIKEIHDIIAKNLTKIEKDFKTKSTTYNNLKSNLAQHEKKETGSLVTRNLGPIVKEEDFVVASEYLVTACVVVPKLNVKEWEGSYWKLADFVVPGSSHCVYQDGEQFLYTVTMFKKTMDAFKNNAREKKFIVRDFTYSKERIDQASNEVKNLQKAKDRAYVPLIRWLKGNFSEAFVNWLHVKALRLFTESVLRYGLPATFLTVALEPSKKLEKKLREKLHSMYSELDINDVQGAEVGEIPGVFMGGDYYPYVSFDVNTAFVDTARDF